VTLSCDHRLTKGVNRKKERFVVDRAQETLDRPRLQLPLQTHSESPLTPLTLTTKGGNTSNCSPALPDTDQSKSQ
jgi:hypothetical protein